MSESQESLKAQLFDILKQSKVVCCDCGVPAPEWASSSLGIFICVECSVSPAQEAGAKRKEEKKRKNKTKAEIAV
jgi:hypothetical protein